MGLDGGTYVTRSDVLRGASWALSTADTSRSTRGGNVQSGTVFKRRRLEPRAEKTVRWTTCALSGQPLAAPIAVDWLGSLFNRAAVLELLLGRAAIFADDAAQDRYINQLRVGGLAFDHLRSKRDIFTVHLAERPPAEAIESASSRFLCPITGSLCEQVPFSALATCGHAFSDRAIRQMTDGTCAVCGVSFAPDDVVPLNGTDEQIAAQRERLNDWRQRQKGRQAKGKKRKVAEEPADERTTDAKKGEGGAQDSQTAAGCTVAKRRGIALQACASAAPDSQRACTVGLNHTSAYQRT